MVGGGGKLLTAVVGGGGKLLTAMVGGGGKLERGVGGPSLVVGGDTQNVPSRRM